MHADFDCLLPKIDTCVPDQTKSYTIKQQIYEPYAISYYIKYENVYFRPPVVYREHDAMKIFLTKLKEDTIEIKKKI